MGVKRNASNTDDTVKVQVEAADAHAQLSLRITDYASTRASVSETPCLEYRCYCQCACASKRKQMQVSAQKQMSDAWRQVSEREY